MHLTLKSLPPFACVLVALLSVSCSQPTVAGLPACTAAPDVETAIHACSAVIDSKSSSTEERAIALSYRGGALSSKGMRKESTADLDESVRLLPRSADMLANRGANRVRLGDTDAALADFAAALRLDPRNALAIGNRGIIHEQRGEYPAARADMDLAISIDPKAWQPWSERCWIGAVLADELPKTLADCNHSVQMQPRDPNTYNSRGLVNFRMGHFKEAIADYDQAIGGDPGVASSWMMRGLAKKAAGMDGAQADIDKGKTMDPKVAARYASYGVAVD
jgi:tetratricopeptide (TPR) repeat protein